MKRQLFKIFIAISMMTPMGVHLYAAGNAYVNVQQIYEEYKEREIRERNFKTLMEQVQKERDALVKKMEEIRAKIDKNKQKLEAGLVDDKTKADLQKEIEKDEVDMKNLFGQTMQLANGLKEQQQRAMQDIFKQIEGAIATIGKESGYTLIFNANAICYAKEENGKSDGVCHDATKEVIEYLNRSYKEPVSDKQETSKSASAANQKQTTSAASGPVKSKQNKENNQFIGKGKAPETR